MTRCAAACAALPARGRVGAGWPADGALLLPAHGEGGVACLCSSFRSSGLPRSPGARLGLSARPLPPGFDGTEVLDRQDRPLALLPAPGGVWRFRCERLPSPLLTDLLIAVEDRRFWYHPGVDPLALARATVQFVRTGHVVSGGSTLAMQAARLLEPRPRTLRSKLIEMARAVQLEARYGRQGVLDIWLTLAPFGGNLEGVRAGSLAWFGVPPEALEPAQAALLVAIPRRPERLRPDRHRAAATAMRDRVLAVGVRDGLFDAAADAGADRPRAAAAPRAADSPPSCRACRVVRTTLDLPLQAALERLGRERTGDPAAAASLACWWPMPTRARSARCIPAPGATRRAPARST